MSPAELKRLVVERRYEELRLIMKDKMKMKQ